MIVVLAVRPEMPIAVAVLAALEEGGLRRTSAMSRAVGDNIHVSLLPVDCRVSLFFF